MKIYKRMNFSRFFCFWMKKHVRDCKEQAGLTKNKKSGIDPEQPLHVHKCSMDFLYVNHFRLFDLIIIRKDGILSDNESGYFQPDFRILKLMRVDPANPADWSCFYTPFFPLERGYLKTRLSQDGFICEIKNQDTMKDRTTLSDTKLWYILSISKVS